MFGGGGGSPELAAFAWGTGGGTTTMTVGSTSGNNVIASNSEYFSVADGVFTCRKAGSYTVIYFARGGRGSNTNRTCIWSVKKNESNIANGTANYSSGVSSSVSATFAVDDTLYAQCASGGSAANGGYWSMGYAVVPA